MLILVCLGTDLTITLYASSDFGATSEIAVTGLGATTEVVSGVDAEVTVTFDTDLDFGFLVTGLELAGLLDDAVVPEPGAAVNGLFDGDPVEEICAEVAGSFDVAVVVVVNETELSSSNTFGNIASKIS